MAASRVIIGVLIGLVAVFAIAAPAFAQASYPYGLHEQSDHAFSTAESSAEITVTSPASGTSYAAYPTGSYSFPDRSGTFAPALFEETADLVTVRWQAIGVAGDVTVKVIMDGETIHSGTVAASAGSYLWQPAVAYGQTYSHYANCHATVASLLDPAVEGTSPTFALIPWGTVVQEWNGLQVYSNFPRPNWIAPGVSSIPVFGDSGAGFRYQCVELAQRWTTQTQHWQDKNGNALPAHWAGSYAKDMLTIAQVTYGLPTVSNDRTATSPPDVGDLLVWGTGTYGHVAVVGAVEGDRLRIYEQNGANPEGTRTLALTRNSGKVWVDQDGVIGWIKPLQRHTFTDIDSSPYQQAIESLAQAGIVGGYPDGAFRPLNPVIRQQFAKMIVKTLNLPVSENDVSPFTDVMTDMGSTDPLYPDHYVAVCAANGITQGRTADTFAPYDNMTRQQLITMIVRAANLPDAPPYYVPPFGPGQFYPEEHYQNARRAAYVGLLNKIEGVGPAFDFFSPATRGEVAGMLYNLLNRPAPGEEEAAISQAIGRDLSLYPSEFSLSLLRIVDSWAGALIIPHLLDLDRLELLLHEVEGEWTVVDYGTGYTAAEWMADGAPAELAQRDGPV